jgi:hypothetical protein
MVYENCYKNIKLYFTKIDHPSPKKNPGYNKMTLTDIINLKIKKSVNKE